MNDQTPPNETSPPPKKRKKSQKRQRDQQIKTPLTKDEFNRVAANASAAGLSHAAYSRACMLGDAGPRSQRSIPLDAGLVRQAIAKLAKYENNMNQTAYGLNAYGEGGLAADFKARIAEVEEIIDAFLLSIGKKPRSA